MNKDKNIKSGCDLVNSITNENGLPEKQAAHS
jgi:hypothetical protein